MAVLAFAIGLAGTFLAATAEKASGLTPNSPEVQAAVDKGITFLESDAAVDSGDRLGAIALQGYSLLCHGADPSHIKVVAAAAKLQKAMGNRDLSKVAGPEWTNVWDVYSTGLSIIFLVKLDPKKYHSDIEFLLAYLRKRQKPHGGWGYAERDTGDTSMTQYGVLSSYVAKKAGFRVPDESIDAVAGWLLKTQDPNGGFGYQGIIGAGGLVAQDGVRQSMTAAGSGSLYVCADMFGMIDKKEEKDEKLPSALKEIKAKEKEPAKERVRSRIDVRLVREAEDRSKKWMEANNKVDDSQQWVHYYLYALERCMAFREFFDHKPEKEPEWYNDGAAFLMKSQGQNGSWNGQCGPVADTAFSVLFLMRNTKKVIGLKAQPYGEGTMIGGRGIPKDTSRIELQNGNIVARPLLGPGEALIRALENPDSRRFDESVERLADLPSDQFEKLAAKYGDKIRQLVRSKSPEARLAAVKALGTTRDLDNVEMLIYALTDPDYRVVRAANDGLLRIRRVPVVIALPENFSEEDRRLLVEKWKAWYQTIRPSADVRY